ncbi:hypothetical protein AGMMS50268_30090 [Spirochaetia bacterium]|nr:hypothetical protein AGMMS50268_30090 [Spirochaetia bacterium]
MMDSSNNPDSVIVLTGSHKIQKADVISGICAACQKKDCPDSQNRMIRCGSYIGYWEAAIHKYLGHDQPKRFHVVVQDNSFLVIDIKNDVIRGSCGIYDDAVTFAEELENEKEDD